MMESETEQVSLLPGTDPQNTHRDKRAKPDDTQNVLQMKNFDRRIMKTGEHRRSIQKSNFRCGSVLMLYIFWSLT